MKNPYRAAAAAAVVVAVFFLFPHGGLATSAHQFTARDCQGCHNGAETSATTGLTAPDADISPQCVNCHSACDNWSGHRSSSPRRLAMAEALPLSEEGRIVCVTCHTPHVSPSGDRHGEPLRISNLKRGLCLNCHGRFGDDDIMLVSVTTPPGGIMTKDDYVPLIGKVYALADDHLDVTINGVSFRLPVTGGGFQTRLRIQDGMNSISLNSRGGRLWQTEVFKASKGIQEEGFKRVYAGHQTGSREECAGCHDGGGRNSALSADAPAELCYRCHAPFEEKRFLHGPIAVGACLSCHDPHGGFGNASLRQKEVPLCLSCHDAGDVQGHRGGAEALAGGSCSECHDPHQSDTRFFIKQASN